MRYSTCQLRLADILFLERLFLWWHAYQRGGRRGLSCKLANRSKNSISAKRSWQVEYLINAWAIHTPPLLSSTTLWTPEEIYRILI